MNVVDVDSIVSKSDFARLTNVTPGRVTQWISEGKIKDNALDGQGRDAKIRVGPALAQLKRRLNTDQRFGNGSTTRLELAPQPGEGSAVAPGAPPRAPAPTSAEDDVADRIQLEKLAQLERTNRIKAREEAEKLSLLTDSTEAKRLMGVIASQMVTVFEGSLAEFASAVAAQWRLPQRDVLHLLRGKFRDVRANAAKTLKDRVEGVAELLEFQVEADRPDDGE